MEQTVVTIQKFRDYYYFLSNFFPCRVRIGEFIFPTSEHAYISFKCDDVEWKKICTDPSIHPGTLKKRAKALQRIKGWGP